MKVFLMHRDQDFDLQRALPANEAALTQDLELNTLFGAMARSDKYLFDLARRAVLSSLSDPDAIVYRQRVLADCLEQPDVVRRIYDTAVEAVQGERQIYRSTFTKASPERMLSRSVQVLELFVVALKTLREIGDEHAGAFRSEGFVRFFAMLEAELDDAYLETVERRLQELKFRRGVLSSVELGKGNKGARYVVREPQARRWTERISRRSRRGNSFTIADRDESGFRALSELRNKSLNLIASTLHESMEHVLSFFRLLTAELAFYVGCLNLHDRLAGKGEPLCLPVPLAPGRPVLAARGLYDVCLALHLDGRAVGNSMNADGKTLVMITGANRGGKSTFLRSLGLAQLMMQCGMFVAAESFRADLRDGVFAHFKQEEDASLKSGKLDEELGRMSDIAEQITPSGMLLCNESFAATNEREGSEIARQIIRALLGAGIKVVFVTHMYDLAHSFYTQGPDTTLFLRAERQIDGRRPFLLTEGEPLSTSFGDDLYRRIFGGAPNAAPAATPGRPGRTQAPPLGDESALPAK